jgi:hypothetical protein
VGNDFVEADLDTAFALLSAAETHSLGDDPVNALRAMEEAEKAIADGEQRLSGLNDSDRERLGGRLKRMRALIEGIRSNLK